MGDGLQGNAVEVVYHAHRPRDGLLVWIDLSIGAGCFSAISVSFVFSVSDCGSGTTRLIGRR